MLPCKSLYFLSMHHSLLRQVNLHRSHRSPTKGRTSSKDGAQPSRTAPHLPATVRLLYLVSKKHSRDTAPRGQHDLLIQVLLPGQRTLQRLPVCHVEHDQTAGSPLVVGASQHAIAVLASNIPELHVEMDDVDNDDDTNITTMLMDNDNHDGDDNHDGQ